MKEIPPDPGSYALEVYLSQPIRLQVGCLGEFDFPAGHYIYLGSARGPGGLRARLSRHLRQKTIFKLHWHIDHLCQFAAPNAVCYLPRPNQTQDDEPLECLWSLFFHQLPGCLVPSHGFGSSDCRLGCPAHLYLIENPPRKSVLADADLRRQMSLLAGDIAQQLHYEPLPPEVKWMPENIESR